MLVSRGGPCISETAWCVHRTAGRLQMRSWARASLKQVNLRSGSSFSLLEGQQATQSGHPRKKKWACLLRPQALLQNHSESFAEGA